MRRCLPDWPVATIQSALLPEWPLDVGVPDSEIALNANGLIVIRPREVAP